MTRFEPYRIKVIGFDADDTLWVNEPFYRDSEARLYKLLSRYEGAGTIEQALYQVETRNMELYGYGTKAFILSMIETAIDISGGRVTAAEIAGIIELGKEQIAVRNPLLPGVAGVLARLSQHFRLIVATKGDLLDQERKLKNSGISKFFHHVEVMSDKKEENYSRLLAHLDVKPGEFLMVGNSLRSDVLPVIALGGHAVHIPFDVTWQHEEVRDEEIPEERFFSIEKIEDILSIPGIVS